MNTDSPFSSENQYLENLKKKYYISDGDPILGIFECIDKKHSTFYSKIENIVQKQELAIGSIVDRNDEELKRVNSFVQTVVERSENLITDISDGSYLLVNELKELKKSRKLSLISFGGIGLIIGSFLGGILTFILMSYSYSTPLMNGFFIRNDSDSSLSIYMSKLNIQSMRTSEEEVIIKWKK